MSFFSGAGGGLGAMRNKMLESTAAKLAPPIGTQTQTTGGASAPQGLASGGNLSGTPTPETSIVAAPALPGGGAVTPQQQQQIAEAGGGTQAGNVTASGATLPGSGTGGKDDGAPKPGVSEWAQQQYQDILASMDKGWARTKEMMNRNTAAAQRRSTAGMSGLSSAFGGSAQRGQRQVSLNAQGALDAAGARREDAKNNFMMGWLNKLLGIEHQKDMMLTSAEIEAGSHPEMPSSFEPGTQGEIDFLTSALKSGTMADKQQYRDRLKNDHGMTDAEIDALMNKTEPQDPKEAYAENSPSAPYVDFA